MYERRTQRWKQFCVENGFDAMHAGEDVMALYAASLSKSGLRASTIEQHMSAIRSMRVDFGVVAPPESGLLRRVIKGARTAPLAQPLVPARPPRFPVTMSVLSMIRARIDMARMDSALLWFACLIGVQGLLRSGEFTLASGLSNEAKQLHMLRLSHLRLAADGQTMTLTVPRSKTLIDGFTVSYAKASDDQLCPIRAWQTYEALRRRLQPSSFASDREPLLLTERGLPLSQKELIDQLRRVLAVAGLGQLARRFSGHSFRRGGAQSLFDAGAPIAEIMRAGRWKSTVVHVYLTSGTALASAFSTFFAKAVAIAPGSTPLFDPEQLEDEAQSSTVAASSSSSSSATSSSSARSSSLSGLSVR